MQQRADRKGRKGREEMKGTDYNPDKTRLTSPNVLSNAQLFVSSEECSPPAKEEVLFTSGSDLQ